jgi:excisionase family DNA binding protein
MTSSESIPQRLTMEQLAGGLGVTRRHVRRLVEEKRVPFLRVGRFIRFNPEQIAAWLASNGVPALAPANQRCRASAQPRPSETSPPRSLQVEGPNGRAEEQGGHP